MSEHYTQDDVEVAAAAIGDEKHRVRFLALRGEIPAYAADIRHARAVLDAVAPAIATRAKAEALRDFAHGLAIARIVSDHDPDQSQTSQTLTAVIDDMFDRANEIERADS